MLLKDTGGGDFQQPEPGSYAARCYKVIDIGTQQGEYQGKATFKRQVIIAWELDEHMEDGKPFSMSKFYTASLSEKANLRKDLENWRGRQFTPEELGGFDAKKLIGTACLLNLTRNDKGKIRVTGVAKLPKGMTAPEAVNKPVFFSLDNFDANVFDGLSDGLKKMIVQSPEYVNVTQAKGRDIDRANAEAQMAGAEECPF